MDTSVDKIKMQKYFQEDFVTVQDFPFCFAPVLMLIPKKTEIKGEQRFRCISEWVIHPENVVINQE